MITLQEICSYLEEYLSCSLFQDYGPNGLQVEGRQEVRKIATAVSASLATIEAAVSLGVDALFVHHGMFWKGDPFPITGTKQKKLKLLIENEISLLAYHLPLDAHQEIGNNWRAAMDMGWKNLAPFEMDGIPLGVMGEIKAQDIETFREALEAYYCHPAHCAFGGQEVVEKVGLISGGAYKVLPQAASMGLDCYITGNFDEPVWHQAFEEKINFFAMGHSATERVGPKALGEHLEKKYRLEYQFVDIPNPF